MRTLILLFLVVVPVAADEDYRRNDVTVDTNVVTDVTTGGTTIGDTTTTVGGSSTRAYGFSFGGVEINQCYRTYQVLLWQDSRVNPLCLADSYDQKGLHIMAAVIRCDVRLIRKHFSSDDECVDANTMQPIIQPVEVVEPSDLGGLYNQSAQLDIHFERDLEHEHQLEQIQYQLEEQQAQLAQWQHMAEQSAVHSRQAKLYAREELDRLKGYLSE